jgi:hypothetical protein
MFLHRAAVSKAARSSASRGASPKKLGHSEQRLSPHVRFGSKADVCGAPTHVRFGQQNRHWDHSIKLNPGARPGFASRTPFSFKR